MGNRRFRQLSRATTMSISLDDAFDQPTNQLPYQPPSDYSTAAAFTDAVRQALKRAESNNIVHPTPLR